MGTVAPQILLGFSPEAKAAVPPRNHNPCLYNNACYETNNARAFWRPNGHSQMSPLRSTGPTTCPYTVPQVASTHRASFRLLEVERFAKLADHLTKQHPDHQNRRWYTDISSPATRRSSHKSCRVGVVQESPSWALQGPSRSDQQRLG